MTIHHIRRMEAWLSDASAADGRLADWPTLHGTPDPSLAEA